MNRMAKKNNKIKYAVIIIVVLAVSYHYRDRIKAILGRDKVQMPPGVPGGGMGELTQIKASGSPTPELLGPPSQGMRVKSLKSIRGRRSKKNRARSV